MDCSTPDLSVHTNSRSLLKLMYIKPVMPSNHLSLCCPLLLLPSIFPSIRVFSNESVLRISGQSIGTSNEYLGLISFRVDCLDLLAVQGTLRSLLQHYSWRRQYLLKDLHKCSWLSKLKSHNFIQFSG